MDPELEALRRARMQQLQGGAGEQAQQAAKQQEMTNNMLGQILDQSARARLNNVAMVNPTKAQKVEAMLIQMARQGQVSSLKQGSTERQVLEPIGPRFSKFCWSLSGPRF